MQSCNTLSSMCRSVKLHNLSGLCTCQGRARLPLQNLEHNCAVHRMDVMLSKSTALSSAHSAFAGHARRSVIAQRTARQQRSFRTTLQPSAFKFLKQLGFEKPSWLPSFKKEQVEPFFGACMLDPLDHARMHDRS